MQITVEEYRVTLNGFYICDCIVRNRNIFGFVADSWYTDEQIEEEERNRWDPAFRPKRVLMFFRDKPPGSQWGGRGEPFYQWGRIQAGAALLPKNQMVAVELEDDRVYVNGSGESYEESPLLNWRKGGFVRGGIRRLKTIDGYLYACGGNRSVGKRLGKGDWYSHTQSIPVGPEFANTDEGFKDIDGFHENDIYAVGGRGDVWRYDGQRWHQVPLPTNEWLYTVCCGGDGNVYISGQNGLTFVGRENRWKQIKSFTNPALYWRDLVWHDDRVWCTDDNGLWTIHDGKVEYVSSRLPSEISVCAGHLYVNDGVLLMAGLGGAAFLENGQWQSIVVCADMAKQLRAGRT